MFFTDELDYSTCVSMLRCIDNRCFWYRKWPFICFISLLTPRYFLIPCLKCKNNRILLHLLVFFSCKTGLLLFYCWPLKVLDINSQVVSDLNIFNLYRLSATTDNLRGDWRVLSICSVLLLLRIMILKLNAFWSLSDSCWCHLL